MPHGVCRDASPSPVVCRGFFDRALAADFGGDFFVRFVAGCAGFVGFDFTEIVADFAGDGFVDVEFDFVAVFAVGFGGIHAIQLSM